MWVHFPEIPVFLPRTTAFCGSVLERRTAGTNASGPADSQRTACSLASLSQGSSLNHTRSGRMALDDTLVAHLEYAFPCGTLAACMGIIRGFHGNNDTCNPRQFTVPTF